MQRGLVPVSLVLGVCIVCLFGCKESSEKLVVMPYPEMHKLSGEVNKYYCEAMVGAWVMAPSDDIGKIKKGVRSVAFRGTDKASVEINGDKLYFQTGASFEAGVSRDPFEVIHNDPHKVFAIERIDSGLTIHIFALNKDTGIATWTKATSEGFFQRTRTHRRIVLNVIKGYKDLRDG